MASAYHAQGGNIGGGRQSGDETGRGQVHSPFGKRAPWERERKSITDLKEAVYAQYNFAC